MKPKIKKGRKATKSITSTSGTSYSTLHVSSDDTSDESELECVYNSVRPRPDKVQRRKKPQSGNNENIEVITLASSSSSSSSSDEDDSTRDKKPMIKTEADGDSVLLDNESILSAHTVTNSSVAFHRSVKPEPGAHDDREDIESGIGTEVSRLSRRSLRNQTTGQASCTAKKNINMKPLKINFLLMVYYKYKAL